MILQEKVRAKGYELGASCYQLANYALEDADWFLSSVAKNGGTMSELFFNFTWQAGWQNAIFPIVKFAPDIDSNGNALFDGYEFPIWDINRFSSEKVKKWIEIFKLFAKYDLTLYLRIHDFCSLKDKFKNGHYPFQGRNVQHEQGLYGGGMWWAWSADSDHPYGDPAKGKQITPYYRKALIKLIDMLTAAHTSYRLVMMNEADYLADKDDSEKVRDGKVVLWHKWHIEALLGMGVKKDQIIISTSRALPQMAKWGYTMEIHGVNSPERLAERQKTYAKIVPAKRFFPNGDGPDPYAKGRRGDAPTKREPSNVQARTIAVNLGESQIYAYFSRPCDTLGVHKMRARAMAQNINYFNALKSLAQVVIR